MEKFKTFSLGIAMLISFLAFGQEKTKSEAGKEDDSTKVIEKNLADYPMMSRKKLKSY